MTFGRFLREKRQVAKLTQEEAAAAAGMTRAMWAKLEAGESGTSRKKVPGIALALQTDLAETYQRAGFAPDEPEQINVRVGREVERLLLRLPPQHRERVEELILADAEKYVCLLTAA